MPMTPTVVVSRHALAGTRNFRPPRPAGYDTAREGLHFPEMDRCYRSGGAAMRSGPLSPEQLSQYERDGYLLVPRMFDAEEIGLLLRSAKADRALDQHAFGRADGEGGAGPPVALEPPGRRHLRHVRPLPAGGGRLRAAPRRRGLPLPLQDDHEGPPASAGRGPGTRTTATGTRTASSSPTWSASSSRSTPAPARTAACR